MSRDVRLSMAVLGVLAALLVAAAPGLRAGAGAGTGTGAGAPSSAAREPVPFPATLTVAPIAAPAIAHVDDPRARIAQLLAGLDAMWSGAFARSGGPAYTPPRVEWDERVAASSCGGAPASAAGFYCPASETLHVDLGLVATYRAALGDVAADDLIGVVLAHEVGHHVQALRGVDRAPRARSGAGLELHADCLAGVWLQAVGRMLPHGEHLGTDAVHGSPEEQMRAFALGYDSGRPAACDVLWQRGGV